MGRRNLWRTGSENLGVGILDYRSGFSAACESEMALETKGKGGAALMEALKQRFVGE